ncbi:permease for cytosine/purines, uracil, thiamine, allantoin-domain-containing protein [Lipomyces starkeyi]
MLKRLEVEPTPVTVTETWTLFLLKCEHGTGGTISHWISDNFTPSGWCKAASLMQIGMSWRIALLNVAVSEILIAAVITINGYVGAKYHISFTVQSRASFGYYFSILMICMRMIVGTFWYGISTYTGAECVRSMIFTLPASSHINTQFMISYFVYIMVSDFFLVHKGKYDVWELYNKDGIYRYNKWGVNWRSVVEFTTAGSLRIRESKQKICNCV